MAFSILPENDYLVKLPPANLIREQWQVRFWFVRPAVCPQTGLRDRALTPMGFIKQEVWGVRVRLTDSVEQLVCGFSPP